MSRLGCALGVVNYGVTVYVTGRQETNRRSEASVIWGCKGRGIVLARFGGAGGG